MEEFANSSIRNRNKPEKRIANGNENEEQVRELRELQRGLAERIRKIQRGAPYSQPGESI